jgi:hypothetical protein
MPGRGTCGAGAGLPLIPRGGAGGCAGGRSRASSAPFLPLVAAAQTVMR